jgi:hypothetical protein
VLDFKIVMEYGAKNGIIIMPGKYRNSTGERCGGRAEAESGKESGASEGRAGKHPRPLKGSP